MQGHNNPAEIHSAIQNYNNKSIKELKITSIKGLKMGETLGDTQYEQIPIQQLTNNKSNLAMSFN